MDPNATLRRIEEPHDGQDREEACEELQAWLARGGFSPDWEDLPLGTTTFRRWQKRTGVREEGS